MFTHPQVAAALRKVESKAEFAARHDIAARTLYNLLTPPWPDHKPTRATLKLVGSALLAEGLLKEPKARGKKKAAA